jgi:hypothetical protein
LLPDARVFHQATHFDLLALPFKLGFDQGKNLCPLEETKTGQDRSQGNKGEIDGNQVYGFGQVGRLQMADINAISDFHPRILTQTPGQLAFADV